MQEEGEGASSCEEALEPATVRGPGEPTREERIRHEQAQHLDRSRRRFCVMPPPNPSMSTSGSRAGRRVKGSQRHLWTAGFRPMQEGSE